MIDANIELTGAVLIYVGGGHDVYHRPYDATVDGRAWNDIMHATDDGTRITPNALSGVAATILSPTFVHEGMVQIPNGMSNGRYAFVLEITADTIYGKEREIIRGFTDYDGVSPHTGAIDPQLKFHLNSRLVIKQPEITNAYGTVGQNILSKSQNILAEVPNNQNAIALRPEDAVTWKQTEVIRASGARCDDTRTMLCGIAKTSDRLHAFPSHYLSDICNGFLKGNDLSTYSFNGNTDQLENVLGFVKSESIGVSYFYNALHTYNPSSSHTVSFADIMRRWPRDRDFWVTFMPKPGTALASSAWDTEHWGGATLETQIAYSLTHMLPALMAQHMLVELHITLTNMTPGNMVFIQPYWWRGMFEGTVTVNDIERIVGTVELDIVKGLLLSRVACFDISLSINLLSNSTFEISINGGNKISYNAPMYCDSYYSPMIGQNFNNLVNISNTIETLTDNLSQLRSPDAFSGLGPGHATSNSAPASKIFSYNRT